MLIITSVSLLLLDEIDIALVRHLDIIELDHFINRPTSLVDAYLNVS